MDSNGINRQQLKLPGWMLDTAPTYHTKAAGGNLGFIRRTLTEISKVIQDDLLSERNAEKRGLLQRIDPRVKLFSILLYMVLAGVTGKFLTLMLLGVLAAAMVKLSQLDFVSYIKRVWLVLPLIMFVMSLPAATNIFIPGTPALYLYKGSGLEKGWLTLPAEVYFSAQGLQAILRMSLRVGISFSFGYVLVMTTHWSKLARSLTVLHVPRLIITILDMTYRYIFVLSRISFEMFEARFLRTVGKIDNRENRRFISGGIGYLFIKANHYNEEVYHAMVCRGYTGEPVHLSRFRLGRQDMLWMINSLIIMGILLGGEILIG